MLSESGHLVELPAVRDVRGDLGIVEGLPFPIAEVVWTRDPARCRALLSGRPSLLVALAGTVCVGVDDGSGTRELLLDRPDLGIALSPGELRTIGSGPGDCVCLALLGPAT